MSIHDYIYKIKDKTTIDKTTILYLFIIIGVGISSFGLGRLSVINSNSIGNKGIIIKTDNLVETSDLETRKNNDDILAIQTQSTGKRYVASKNGVKYYPLGCGGAKRIKPENEVWFSTTEEAEKAGYTKSSTCK